MANNKEQEIKDALEKLGVQQLRPQQRDPMRAVLSGVDTLVTMPTGGGKSLLYQLPAVLDPESALTLVMSPLRALQRDQVQVLTRKGIRAAVLNSDLTPRKHLDTLVDFCRNGGLLYLAPEQLQRSEVANALRNAEIARIAVDESHILAQTQDDFRKAYGKIGSFVQSVKHQPQILAMTATATRKDIACIKASLHMKDAKLFRTPMRRDNLLLSVKLVEAKGKRERKAELERNRFQAVERVLRKWNGEGAVIIYCPTVKMVRRLSKWLKARGYITGKYHGKMKQDKRERAQAAFMNGKRPIIVATNAFGLGIDKPDVRLIIHAGLPLSMDGYVQEIGRAGRDGRKSRCVMFFSRSDFDRNTRILTQSGKKKAVCRKLKRLNALHDLTDSGKCIWCCIERYFGEKKRGRCEKCSNCRLKKCLKEEKR